MKLQNGKWLTVDHWDLIIAHPPCTYLRQHSLKMTPENRIEGATITIERIHAMEFFMRCFQAPCDKVAVENPVGIMNTAFRQPDQIIEPYQFASSINDTENYVTKRTCLWLKGLPPLKTNELPRPNTAEMYGRLATGKARSWTESHCYGDHAGVDDAVERAKTFPGIAKAMAAQWGDYIGKE